MREFFRKIIQEMERENPVVLVSILTSAGSTPRGTGAMMAVFPDGSIAGTIGGGNVEFQAQKAAADLLKTGKNAVRSFRLVQGNSSSLGMVCGGDVTLLFQFLPADDRSAREVFERLVELSCTGKGAWLLRKVEGERVTAMRAADSGGRTDPRTAPLLGEHPLLTAEGWFSIPTERPGLVYLFGGGHVSQELAAVLARTGFRTVVYDDREEFASPALFPEAEKRICAPFSELDRHVSVTADDYVVIMTRGHAADYEVLERTLRSGAKYLGCIGSRTKLTLCRDRLFKAGFTPEEYARVHAPIGLCIGARTPAEIAVAVAAEMIAVRSGAET